MGSIVSCSGSVEPAVLGMGHSLVSSHTEVPAASTWAPAPGTVPVSGSFGFLSMQGRMIPSVPPEGTLTSATDHSLPA